MDYNKYLGFKVEDVCSLLDVLNIKYEVRETWDTKKTKLGNDCRIIKIVDGDIAILYSAFF